LIVVEKSPLRSLTLSRSFERLVTPTIWIRGPTKRKVSFNGTARNVPQLLSHRHTIGSNEHGGQRQERRSFVKKRPFISQLDNATEIEQAQEDALDGIVGRYKKRIDSLDWSEEYKRAFMKGFDEKYQESIAVRRPVVASEKEWMNSLRDLYVFVSNKRPYFSRSGDNIAIVQTETLDQFNEKIGHANELRQKYLDSKKVFDEKEKEGLGKLGLSAHDLGRAE
jgi:hypothetical protein